MKWAIGEQRISLIGRVSNTLAARAIARANNEFLLVAACCRWPPDDERTSTIRAAASEPLDWVRLLDVVSRHRVWGHVRNGLIQASVVLPTEVDATLSDKAAALSRRNLALAGETARLHRTLKAANIPALFVKGATLAALTRSDFGETFIRDMDLLVSPTQVNAVICLLEQAGYVPSTTLPPLSRKGLDLLLEYGKEWEFEKRTTGYILDLHWRLVFDESLMKGIDVSSPTMAVSIGSDDVPTLRYEELFVYLCVHGAQHSWMRLKWLADLAALLSVKGAPNTESLYRFAQERGAGRSAGQALLLCERLLGLKIPEPLAAKLRSAGMPSLLEALSLGAILGSRAEAEFDGPGFGRLFREIPLFLLGEGRGHAWRQLRTYLILPVDVMEFAFPARFAWLYILLRVPLWASRRFVRKRHPQTLATISKNSRHTQSG